MSTRVFALLIGIDAYKSGNIWNLQSCVDDAKRIRHWLTDDLNVPRDQIRMLLDNHATKQTIEDNFMEHLINNTAIEKGDAIFIYFSGHGSTVSAPRGWNPDSKRPTGVEVLCTYDCDTKQGNARIAGIPDRSMHALIDELAKVKGNNITLMLDCCFSPDRSSSDIRNRSHTRWTPTTKVKPDDLYNALWPGARSSPHLKGGFSNPHRPPHTLVAACGSGYRAVEGKEGGKFTAAFLKAVSEVSLHRTSYISLLERITSHMGDGQSPICVGQNKSRILFDGIPFVPNSQYVSVDLDNDKRLRIEMGAIQGVVEGSEFSLHIHNYRGSLNPSIAIAVVSDVHPTWSLGHTKTSDSSVPQTCWAHISKWNNRRPFRVHLKTTFTSLFRRWKIRKSIPSTTNDSPSKGGLNILRVKHAAQADISVTVGSRDTIVERHDDVIAANCRQIVRIESKGALDVIDDAARFHLHLHRRNLENPLRNLVDMELFRLDPASWKKIGNNLLEDGKLKLPYERGTIYSVVIRNRSQLDLWPYLLYMDPNSYGITLLYRPDPALSPLPRGSHLEIGSGKPGSEALSFALPDNIHLDSGFLKLFLSSTPLAMGMIEQGLPLVLLPPPAQENPSLTNMVSDDICWDTNFARVTFIRDGRP
ncbi:caspase domain-containing protein [Infundibulicybe gibba]|nr:caspase domain-containing protein [Infundibulicybe gibba]